MTPPPPGTAAPSGRTGLRRALAELPLALGVAFAMAWWWLFGAAFVLDGQVEGYGWDGYLAGAWTLAHGMTPRYDYFHGPLMGTLVGHLGEGIGSYPHAAVIVASTMGLLTALGAGLGARALAGPWAGGLAMALTPLTANAVDMVRWANPYPVLAAFTSVSLGLALATARWPRLGLGLLTGVAAGLCSVADTRGLLVLPIALALVLLGATSRRRGWLLPLVFALGLGARPAFQAAIDWHPRLTQADRLHTQRRVVLRWVESSRDEALIAACAPLGEGDYLTEAHLKGPCAPALLRHNLQERLPAHLPLGLGLSLVAAVFVLLPGGRGRRGTIEGALLLGGLGLGVGALFVLTPMVDRYLVQLAGPAVLLPAAGFGRLAMLAPGRPGRVLPPVLMGGLLAWVLVTDPAERSVATALQLNPATRTSPEAVARLHRDFEPGRDALLDCSQTGVGLSLLPWIPHEVLSYRRFPEHRLDDAEHCVTWIQTPPIASGTVGILVHGQDQVRSGRSRVVLRDVLEQTPGWSQAWTQGALEAWYSQP